MSYEHAYDRLVEIQTERETGARSAKRLFDLIAGSIERAPLIDEPRLVDRADDRLVLLVAGRVVRLQLFDCEVAMGYLRMTGDGLRFNQFYHAVRWRLEKSTFVDLQERSFAHHDVQQPFYGTSATASTPPCCPSAVPKAELSAISEALRSGFILFH